MKNILIGLLTSIVLLGAMVLPSAASGQSLTILRLMPSSPKASAGQTFTVDISIVPGSGVNVAGAQFNLSFNPAAVSVNSVTEGGFLKQGGASTYFMAGIINNTTGNLTGVVDVILGAGQNVTTQGVIVRLSCTAKAAGTTSNFALLNVLVGNKDGQSLPLGSPEVSQVTVSSLYDLNLDGVVNINDLVLAGQAMGATGPRKEDINGDLIVNILDLILIGQHFD